MPFTVAKERWHDVLTSVRHTARLPFPAMYVQYDGHAFRRGLLNVQINKNDACVKNPARR